MLDSQHLVTRIHDTPHAHEPHAAHAHVHEVPVLSGPHVHHPASVVGLLVHQPVAVHHVAGHAVVHAVAVHDVVAVIHQLMHLTTEVLPLVDPHPVGSSVHGDHTARPDALSHSHHAHVVGVLSPPH